MEQLPIVIGGLILAGVLWIAKTVHSLSVDVAKMATTLTGATGDNGVVGDVKALRDRAHAQANDLHALMGRADITDLRLNQIDERLSA